MSGHPTLNGKRFLLIEDDFYLASDEAATLKEAGATIVGCTADPDEARKIIDHEFLDCALVDINLGYGPAFDTARALQERQIPFLFTTGYDAAAIPAEFSAVPRLEKPFDNRRLLTAIEMLI